MTARWTDEHGHAWPITGDWCQVCNLPLTVVETAQTTHPGCGPDPTKE